MVSIIDILIKVFIGLYWFISSILLAVFVHPILIIPNLIIVALIGSYFDRRKIISPYVKDDFLKLGYEITNERPLKFSEFKTEFNISFEPTINHIPISRFKYFKRFTRIFHAINNEGKTVMINAEIFKKWNGDNEIELIEVKKI